MQKVDPIIIHVDLTLDLRGFFPLVCPTVPRFSASTNLSFKLISPPISKTFPKQVNSLSAYYMSCTILILMFSFNPPHSNLMKYYILPSGYRHAWVTIPKYFRHWLCFCFPLSLIGFSKFNFICLRQSCLFCPLTSLSSPLEEFLHGVSGHV